MTSSPTVSIPGLYSSLITSINDSPAHLCVTADIGCAYLNAKMPKYDPEKLVFIRIDSDIAALLVEVDSNIVPSVRKDGSIVAELNRCIESAIVWYEELSQTLLSL